MRLDDDELLGSLMTFDMREVHHEDRPMRGTREYLVRVVLRLLADDVQHGVYKFDFDKLYLTRIRRRSTRSAMSPSTSSSCTH